MQNTPAMRPAASLLELIGNTPLVPLRRISPRNGATIWGKCEHTNPGGSVKDRIALAMIVDAEQKGDITPGKTTIVEPTSGNTGVGLALVCAAKGYELILTMPESMSSERRSLLRSYGATLMITDGGSGMQGAVEKAHELLSENVNLFMPDQFRNPANPMAHEQGTAREISAQIKSQIDAFVACIGTGGTITGCGRVFKEQYPQCLIVGVEPKNSAVLSGQKAGPHRIQGIGAGFIPEILNRDVISNIMTIEENHAFDMAKRMAREEGLLVGISAGANVHSALQMAKNMTANQNIVTILCDRGDRYLSMEEFA